MKIVTEDDEYYETMIRAENRIDPKDEIAKLKQKNVAIYETIITAHRALSTGGHEYEAKILNEVHKILIDLDEAVESVKNPQVSGYGMMLFRNITAPEVMDQAFAGLPVSAARAARAGVIRGNGNFNFAGQQQQEGNSGYYQPTDYATPAARAARIEENRLNQRTPNLFSMGMMGLPTISRPMNNDQSNQALSSNPLNDAARRLHAIERTICHFRAVDCGHRATCMNEHGTPLCDRCSERDYLARGQNHGYEILPLDIEYSDPTR